MKRTMSAELHDRDVQFPGEIAGASLKQIGHDVVPIEVYEIPRRNRRGLIEAHLIETGTLRGLVIPRRNRRGLIEARRAGDWMIHREEEFPGEIAGASLKPRRARDPGARDLANSPAKSPGPH